ncbi:MAG: PKD domain-containing protein, partial [Bacteroidota bacterium]|nr:PKD domain-containing protein [Bacteroidota bacterium]
MYKTTKHFFLFLFIVLISNEFLLAQSTSNTFLRTFNAVGMNGGLALEETSDGGFIGTGQHETSGEGSCDIYAYKVDACGNPEWFKTYGGVSVDGGKCIRQTSDGGYIIAGLATLGVGDYDMIVLKLDALGNVQWSREYGSTVADYGLYVQQTSDGGYIFSGFLEGLGFGSSDLALIKTDAFGNTQWKKIYGGAGADWGDYVQQTSDGGYMVTGYTTSFGAGGADIYLLKVDAFGTVQFSKTYGGAGNDGNSSWGIMGEVTTDGGFIISGNTESFGAGSSDVLLIKTDALGNVQWSKTFGGVGDDQPRFVHQTTDNGYIITGLTSSFGAGSLDAYLIKTDVNGIMQWSKAYGDTGSDRSSAVTQTTDGGYALSVVSTSFGATYFDAVFMKTDSLGVVGCFESNCATIVNDVILTEGSGASEMVTGAIETVPLLATHIYLPTDLFLCSHCTTIPSFVPSDSIICVNDSVSFFNTTSVGMRCDENWYIDGVLFLGDLDTLSLAFSTPGIHIVELVAPCGNTTDTSTVYILVLAKPLASFSNTTVCQGTATSFTDNSTIPVGALSSWSWNFGDGTPFGTTQNPTHTYATGGLYTVTLISANSEGCADTIDQTVEVYFNPVAGFTYSDVCFGNAVSFVNTSTMDPSGTIASYSWTFGDGSPVSSALSPSHVYTAGSYTTTLLVTSTAGCTNSLSSTVNTFDAPVSSFTFSNTCLNANAIFTNTSTSPAMGSVASWSWDFGDGSPLNTTTLSPSHLYAATGNYLVTLINNSSNLGCSDTTSATITVFPMPVAAYTNTTVCHGNATAFTDNSTIPAGSITAWSWNFGDGSALNTLQNPSYIYPNAGIYNVTLIVTSIEGCKDTITQSVEVYFNPVASFTHLDVCFGDSISFTNTSAMDVSGAIASFLWTFGDATPASALTNPVHYYSAAGSYNVILLTTSTDGCSNADTVPVFTFDVPVSSFTFSNTCLTTSAQFTNTSTTPPPSTIASWSWDFGDGSALNTTTYDPAHLYSATGNYQVTLVSNSSVFGCSDTSVATITVYPMPVADFNFTDV